MDHFDAFIQGDKPVVIDFFADWNERCKIMKPVMETVKEFTGERAMVLNMDIEKHPHYAETYKILSVPTVVIFKNGHEVWRKNGFATSEEILEHLPVM